MSVLIDLGEMAPGIEEPPDAPRPVRDRRRAVVALLAVLVLFAVGAAGAPVDPLPRLFSVAALGDAPIMFDGDRMYAIDGRAVVAYSLRDGSRLWRTPTALPPAQGWGLSLFAGTLLLGSYSDLGDAGMVAFDARTGAQRWQTSGSLVASVPHLRSLMVRVGVDLATVHMVDLVSGVVRWSAPWGDCQYDVDDPNDPSLWVRLCPDGTLSTTDLGTGRVTRTAKVDLSAVGPFGSPAYPDGGVRLTVAYGLAVVAVFDRTSYDWWMSGYDLADLGQRWSHRPIGGDEYLIPCPPKRLCTVNDQVSTVISVETGETVGTAPPYWDVAAHQVDVTGYEVDQPPAVVLAPDGAPFDTRSHDAIVFWSRTGDFLTAPRYTSANETWVFDAQPDRTAPDGFRYRPLGKIPGVYATRCVAYARTPAERLLGCATAPNTVTFWAVSPGPA